MADERPELRATVFSDYICPFCYVAEARLDRLRQDYDLRINWCLLEIHPDNPVEGRPVEELGYGEERWAQMMAVLDELAAEEGLTFSRRRITTNSHRALLLAEAAKADGREVFYRLHRLLFERYFGDEWNIGEEPVLRAIAAEAGVPESTLERAWDDPEIENRLHQYRRAAAELRVDATPTFFIGHERLNGAVPLSYLQGAARRALAGGAGA